MISVVMPAYNEESIIERSLRSLLKEHNLEIIVVDGGSSDRTLELAAKYPVRILTSPKNRALQMNKGASFAKGDLLIFLHSDCRVESGAIEKIRELIESGYSGGCLSQRIDGDNFIYRVIESSGNLRARFFGIFYGDQAIFVSRDAFLRAGGFDRVDIMEDVMFSKKIKYIGRTAILNKRVFSSPRRWQNQGLLKTTFLNWLISLGFLLGLAPGLLRKLYLDLR